ncbi:hypothetical protein [Tropicimonas isoalkanivorans]|uniref:Phage protein, HK97 gp10 family n=1 Tax=Tropicimonas isoalkanivorans TaxID=441112 RepID=A0A1I1M3A4_9RHOB|nr:hypothetical protein [Tropicimonas isoalkanivorans]SFC77688.1 hypothetical protein SAMN04488094_10959 [Tropicimonas isoalkanivorans]
MVKGVAAFRKRMRDIPAKVRMEVTAAIEASAEEVVRDMRVLNPLPGDIEIGWTWGKAPKGAISIGRVAGREHDKIGATIYARGDDFAAAWFEFGTSPRFQKTGKGVGRITAQPFFYPAYRANKRRIRSRITRAVKRGMKKA